MFKSALCMAAGIIAALSSASAAERTERLRINILEGDGAGTRLLGSLTFKDDLLPADLSGGFTVTADADDLKVNFPLVEGFVATEVNDFEFPFFPSATFDGEGALTDLQFNVAETELFLDVAGDLSFIYEIGPFDAPLFAGSGRIAGGTAAIPVPAAAFLFAPALGLMVRRRFKKS